MATITELTDEQAVALIQKINDETTPLGNKKTEVASVLNYLYKALNPILPKPDLFDVTADWENEEITDEETFILFLTGCNIENAVISNFQLVGNRITCNLEGSLILYSSTFNIGGMAITSIRGVGLLDGLVTINLDYNNIADWTIFEDWANNIQNGPGTISSRGNITTVGTNFKELMNAKGWNIDEQPEV